MWHLRMFTENSVYRWFWDVNHAFQWSHLHVTIMSNDGSDCVDVCLFVSITIEAACPLCGSKAANSWLLVKKFCQWRTLTSQDDQLVNIFHRLICLLCKFTHPPKKFNDIFLFHLQTHFSTPNFSILKNRCVISRHQIVANFLCTKLQLVSMITW